MQTDALEAPETFENVPGGQGTGSAPKPTSSAVTAQTMPAGQGVVALLAPGGQWTPAGQAKHAPRLVAPKADEYIPAGHREHDVEFGAAYEPAGQGDKLLVEPAAHAAPALHGMHDAALVDPAAAEKVPAGQGAHCAAPALLLYVPAAHCANVTAGAGGGRSAGQPSADAKPMATRPSPAGRRTLPVGPCVSAPAAAFDW